MEQLGVLSECLHIENLLEKLSGIEERYAELNNLLMEVGDDYQRAAELGIERAELEPIVAKAPPNTARCLSSSKRLVHF